MLVCLHRSLKCWVGDISTNSLWLISLISPLKCHASVQNRLCKCTSKILQNLIKKLEIFILLYQLFNTWTAINIITRQLKHSCRSSNWIESWILLHQNSALLELLTQNHKISSLIGYVMLKKATVFDKYYYD